MRLATSKRRFLGTSGAGFTGCERVDVVAVLARELDQVREALVRDQRRAARRFRSAAR
jgi:hypothetical protein